MHVYTAVHMHVAASLAALLQSNCIKLCYTVYILYIIIYNTLATIHMGLKVPIIL